MRSINEVVYIYCTLPCNKYYSPKRLLVLLSVVAAIIVIGFGIGVGISSIYINDRSFRLPKTIVPEHYNLEIQPYLNPGNFKFVGNVKIHLRCVEETDQIVIHSKELDVDENLIKLSDSDNNKIVVSRVDFEVDFDFMKIIVKEKLKKGNSYKLSMKFQGKFASDEKGIFVYNYTDEKNIIHYSALSSFETHFARKAFPCFDEPAMKATFDITVVRVEGMISVSNMPKKETKQRENDWKADIYGISQKISTCYVSFFVGNYMNKTKDKVTIWARPNKISSLDDALDYGNEVLGYYENLLQVPYPLPTLNIIVTEKWTVEGWGMITCPEHSIHTGLLPVDADPLQYAPSTFPVQIGKQWFGILVTPKWWDVIWMSTVLFEYISQEFLSHKFTSFSEAAFSRPLFRPCYLGEPIRELSGVVDKFEHLTEEIIFNINFWYRRGFPVIEMIVFSLGRENFWSGVSLYLNENAYESTDENTLLSYFDKVQTAFESPLNLAEMIKPWTKLDGRPILTVTRNYEEREATIEQVSCRAPFWEENKDDLWNVPIIVISTKSSNKKKSWFSSRQSIIRNMPESDKWILLNSSHTANFVNYDRKNWQLLAKQLKKNHQIFDVRQRLKLLLDIYGATMSNFIEPDIILEMYQYLSDEENLELILDSELFSVVEMYSEMLENERTESIWKEYVKSIFVPISKKVGEEMDDYNLMARSYLNDFFCKIGEENCEHEIQTLFQLWMNENGNNKIHIWNEFLCTVIRYGGNDYWNRVYEDRVKIYTADRFYALACSKNTENIRRILKKLSGKSFFSFAGETIRELTSNEKAWPEFSQYLHENFNSIITKKSFMPLCDYAFDKIRKPEKLDKLISIFEEHVNDLDQEMGTLVRRKITAYKKTLSNLPRDLKYITEWLQNWHNKKGLVL